MEVGLESPHSLLTGWPAALWAARAVLQPVWPRGPALPRAALRPMLGSQAGWLPSPEMRPGPAPPRTCAAVSPAPPQPQLRARPKAGPQSARRCPAQQHGMQQLVICTAELRCTTVGRHTALRALGRSRLGLTACEVFCCTPRAALFTLHRRPMLRKHRRDARCAWFSPPTRRTHMHTTPCLHLC